MANILPLASLYIDFKQLTRKKPSAAETAMLLQNLLNKEFETMKLQKENSKRLVIDMKKEYRAFVKSRDNIVIDDQIITNINKLLLDYNKLTFEPLDEDILAFQLCNKRFENLQKEINASYGLFFRFWTLKYSIDIDIRTFVFYALFFILVCWQYHYDGLNPGIIFGTIRILSDYCNAIFTFDNLSKGQYFRAFSPWFFRIGSNLSVFVETSLPKIFPNFSTDYSYIQSTLNILFSYNTFNSYVKDKKLLNGYFSFLSYLQSKLFDYFKGNDFDFRKNYTKSPLEVLGLDSGATWTQIINAYKNLANIYHPDNKKTGDNDMMVMINAAWETLKQQRADGRRKYNKRYHHIQVSKILNQVEKSLRNI